MSVTLTNLFLSRSIDNRQLRAYRGTYANFCKTYTQYLRDNVDATDEVHLQYIQFARQLCAFFRNSDANIKLQVKPVIDQDKEGNVFMTALRVVVTHTNKLGNEHKTLMVFGHCHTKYLSTLGEDRLITHVNRVYFNQLVPFKTVTEKTKKNPLLVMNRLNTRKAFAFERFQFYRKFE